MAQACIRLVPINSGENLELFTDASNVACGCVLMQSQRPVEFFSKKFQPCEQRYSTFDREALAIVTCVWNFRFVLKGRAFVIHTDHKPVIHWVRTTAETERHARWLTNLQEFNFEIRYYPDERNVLAN